MKQDKVQISLLISAAFAGSDAGVANTRIEDIINTATRHAAGTRNVPVAVQAVSGRGG